MLFNRALLIALIAKFSIGAIIDQNVTSPNTFIQANSAEADTLLFPGITLDIENGDAYSNSNYTFASHEENELSKRTNAKDCIIAVATVGAALGGAASAGAAWYSAFKSSATTVINQSNAHNCGVVHDIVSNGKIRYVYSSSGRNCDTTAQAGTIEGALDKAYRTYMSNNYNAVYCMDLTHGGTWAGYLLIGPNVAWPAGLSCGNNNSGQCVSGGVNDAHS